jgi:hypothetical protein
LHALRCGMQNADQSSDKPLERMLRRFEELHGPSRRTPSSTVRLSVRPPLPCASLPWSTEPHSGR